MKLVHALCEYEYIEQANVMIPTYFIIDRIYTTYSKTY